MRIAERNSESKGNKNRIEASLKELVQLSCRLGASDAAVIFTNDISVENDLAKLCREPQCENFGLSARCPPHIGPTWLSGNHHRLALL